jgi:hypothetical protein
MFASLSNLTMMSRDRPHFAESYLAKNDLRTHDYRPSSLKVAGVAFQGI